MKKAIVIVDPMVSSEYLANRFTQLGYGVIALKTLPDLDYLKSSDHVFDYVIDSSGHYDTDIAKLQKLKNRYQIVHGISGLSASLPYAEALIHKMFPKNSNQPTSTHLRAEKYWMNEQLQRANISAIQQIKLSKDLSTDQKIAQTTDFFNQHNGHIVIKPDAGSAGTVGVIAPKSIQDIKDYYCSGTHKLFLDTNHLLQEKIRGEEFYFDVSSYQGQHHFTAVGKYAKDFDSLSFEYHYLESLDLQSPALRQAKSYVLNCLETLGMHNGLSHVEIMQTSSGDYKLIEINPRISGVHGYINKMSFTQYNTDQINAYVELLENRPHTIENKPVQQRLFVFKNKKGAFQSVDTRLITALPSYQSSKILKPSSNSDEIGGKDLTDTVMLVLLASEKSIQIQQDTQRLIELEQSGQCLK